MQKMNENEMWASAIATRIGDEWAMKEEFLEDAKTVLTVTINSMNCHSHGSGYPQRRSNEKAIVLFVKQKQEYFSAIKYYF